MRRKPSVSAEDAELFRREVGAVRPLRHNRAEAAPARPQPLPRQTWREQAKMREEMLYGDFDPAELETGDEVTTVSPVSSTCTASLSPRRERSWAHSSRPASRAATAACASSTARAIVRGISNRSSRSSSTAGCDGATKCWHFARLGPSTAAPARSTSCSAADRSGARPPNMGKCARRRPAVGDGRYCVVARTRGYPACSAMRDDAQESALLMEHTGTAMITPHLSPPGPRGP